MELTEAIDDNVHQKPTMVTLWEEQSSHSPFQRAKQLAKQRKSPPTKLKIIIPLEELKQFWAFLQLKECVFQLLIYSFSETRFTIIWNSLG